MYVEKHENVSILYADIVNFTELTRKLSISQLVETLNQLFGQFDEAADKFSCHRIKILGDCYYCVSGVPNKTPHHAKNCVRMGLEMIEIIRSVREERETDVDMRIGVHSGSILSGLMGNRKWQFDVWSKDVTIANHMEQAGEPGRVHITKQTKENLGDEFQVETHLNGKVDEYLAENNIERYLVVPPHKSCPQTPVDESDEIRFMAMRVHQLKGQHNTRRGSAAGPVSMKARRRTSIVKASMHRRNTVLMDDQLADFVRTMNTVDTQMQTAIDQIPLRKYTQWFHPEGINPFFLTFDDVSWEVPYQKQPDPLFKFYVTCSFFIFLCTVSMQYLVLPRPYGYLWFSFGSTIVLALILLPCVWSGYVWKLLKDPQKGKTAGENEIYDAGLPVIPPPPSRLLSFLYRTSQVIASSWTARTLIFTLVAIVVQTSALIDMAECNPIQINATDANHTFHLGNYNDSAQYCIECHPCTSPWYFTYSCALGIMASHVFFRVHFVFKLLMSAVSVATFGIVTYTYRFAVFQDLTHRTHNTGMQPLPSHIFYLTFVAAAFHIMDRQMEYISRLDFKWKKQLAKEQDETSTTRLVNKLLLQNILPRHVAQLYLHNNRSQETLYHEQYSWVAVLFASIPNYVDFYTETEFNDYGKGSLKVLNQIICDFDKILYEPQFSHVEKIKVVGSTYMAACGLDPGRKSSSDYVVSAEQVAEQAGANAVTMVHFAAAMMVALSKINRECHQSFQLRIGVDCGPVMAGVVGAQKPFYDIWDNTVNMASRMDSTGIMGNIQVTEKCAEVLMSKGVNCKCRGEIFVKGRGAMTTFTVCLDEHFKIITDDFGSTYL